MKRFNILGVDRADSDSFSTTALVECLEGEYVLFEEAKKVQTELQETDILNKNLIYALLVMVFKHSYFDEEGIVIRSLLSLEELAVHELLVKVGVFEEVEDGYKVDFVDLLVGFYDTRGTEIKNNV